MGYIYFFLLTFMANYQGQLNKHQYVSPHSESRTAKLQLRVAPSFLDRVQSVPDWQEFVRDAILRALDELENSEL